MPHSLFTTGETTPRTRLVLPGPGTYDFLYQLALESGSSFSWKGRAPTRGAIEEVCWADTFEHAVILDRSTSVAGGYVAFSRMNPHHGTVYLSAYLAPGFQLRAAPLEAIGVLMYRLFTYTACRKIYIETTPSSTLRSGVASLFVEEGRLKDFLRVRESYEDLIISAATRADVLERMGPHVRRWTSTPDPFEPVVSTPRVG